MTLLSIRFVCYFLKKTIQMNHISIRARKAKLAPNGTRELYTHTYGYGFLSNSMLEL